MYSQKKYFLKNNEIIIKLPLHENKNSINDFDFSPGRIYHKIGLFDFNKPVSKQDPLALDEDFFAVEYPGNLKLDVSWLPSTRRNGHFIIQVTIDFNYYVFYIRETRKKKELIKYIFEAHEIAKDLVKRKKERKFNKKKERIPLKKIKELYKLK